MNVTSDGCDATIDPRKSDFFPHPQDVQGGLMSGSLIEASKAAQWWLPQIDSAVRIGVDGLADRRDPKMVASALEGLFKSLAQYGNTLFDAREVFARCAERSITIGPQTFSSVHMVAHSLTLDFVHAVWFAIDPVACTELLLGQSHEFRPERVQQPDIWTAVVASLKEFRKKWGLDDSVASEIAARIERERSRLGQEMDDGKRQQVEKEAGESADDDKTSRMTVNVERRTVILDGQPYDVTSQQALRWLKVLADHPDEWISAADLKGYDGELDGARTNKLKPFLPNCINKLITSKAGAGSRLKI